MLTKLIVDKLKERYADLHPLFFHRSVEHAKTDGDLFDILDTVPKKFPIVWCEDSHRWIHVKDLYLTEEFFQEKE